MNKIYSSGAVILVSLLFLSACEVKPDNTADIKGREQCERPELLNQYKKLLNNNFDLLSNKMINKLYTDIIDQQTVHNAMLKSEVALDQFVLESSTDSDGQYTVCNAQLRVEIPPELITLAQQNSLLIYKPIQYDTEIANVSNINAVERDNNIVQLPVRYTLAKNQQIMVDNSELDRINQTLVRMLLPVGVKDMLTVNDEEVDKEDAIQQIISQIGETTEGVDGTIQTDVAVNMVELKSQNQQAQNELKKLWAKMDDTIKNSLSADQYGWSKQANSQCQNQFEQWANRAEKDAEILKCQTNAVLERINYLSGFVIPE